MELGEDSPAAHEIGRRTYLIAPVRPLDVAGLRTVQVGTAIWALAFLALVPFYGRLGDRQWWLWACLAGVGLGLCGYAYIRRRPARTS